ncbi:hypothetical protein [Donghicola mangrovi]|uniref:DUF4258 domain-containing protein n=1 Tax=Donghicola mangrovi TaxID=2729614 RepID=A0A850QDL7_9RHOB|nr:hypothetical protein [Donghicola mangrovi]NVO24990.1 hypothetical protein [Donghicola mangrovi]
MLDLQMTNHAEIRRQQRGFRKADIDVLVALGEPCGHDGYRIPRRVAQDEIQRLKARIRQIERLSESIAIVTGNAVITVHHGENRRANGRRRKGGNNEGN